MDTLGRDRLRGGCAERLFAHVCQGQESCGVLWSEGGVSAGLHGLAELHDATHVAEDVVRAGHGRGSARAGCLGRGVLRSVCEGRK